MKARRKSDGKQIEVTRAFGGYYESDGELYSKADLDFLPEKETAVLEGWVARDNGGFISLFSYRPDRVIKEDLGFWEHGDESHEIDLPRDSFPSVTWESEPKRCSDKD